MGGNRDKKWKSSTFSVEVVFSNFYSTFPQVGEKGTFRELITIAANGITVVALKFFRIVNSLNLCCLVKMPLNAKVWSEWKKTASSGTERTSSMHSCCAGSASVHTYTTWRRQGPDLHTGTEPKAARFLHPPCCPGHWLATFTRTVT